jgi:hypothetical protein
MPRSIATPRQPFSPAYRQLLLEQWDAADAEARRQIAAGEDPTAFADAVKWALRWTSIHSLVQSYPPELVALAVDTGVWSAHHALDVIRLMPDRKRQATCYRLLFQTRKLEGDLLRQMSLEALETIRVPNDHGWDSKYVDDAAAYAPYLPPDLVPELMPLICDMPWSVQEDDYPMLVECGEALSAIGGYFSEAVIDEIIAKIPHYEFSTPHVEILRGLAPHLNVRQFRECLVLANAIDWDYGKARVLTAMLPYAPDELRETIINEAFGSILNDKFGISEDSFGSLYEYLSETKVRTLLERVRQLEAADFKFSSYMTLLEQAPPSIRDMLVQGAQAAANQHTKNPSMLGHRHVLFPYLTLDELRSMVKQVMSNPDAKPSLNWLLEAAHHLPKPEQLDLYGQALRQILAETNVWNLNRDVSGLAQKLPVELLPLIFDHVAKYEAVDAIRTLTPHLTPPLLQQALGAAKAIRTVAKRVIAVSVIAGYMPYQERHALIVEILDWVHGGFPLPDMPYANGLINAIPYEQLSALTIQYLWAKMRHIGSIDILRSFQWQLLPRLTTEQKTAIIQEMFDYYLADYPADRRDLTRYLALIDGSPEKDDILRQVLSNLAFWTHTNSRFQALAEIMPYVPSREQNDIVEEILGVGEEALRSFWTHKETLTAFTKSIAEPFLTPFIELALSVKVTDKYPPHANVYKTLALATTGQLRKQLIEASKLHTLQMQNGESAISNLADLTAIAESDERQDLIEETLKIARQKTGSIWDRFGYFHKAATVLPEHRDQLVREALEVIQDDKWPPSKARYAVTLSSLIPADKREEFIAQQLSMFRYWLDAEDIMKAILESLPHLSPERANALCETALEGIRSMPNGDGDREPPVFLWRLLKYLPEHLLEQWLNQARVVFLTYDVDTSRLLIAAGEKFPQAKMSLWREIQELELNRLQENRENRSEAIGSGWMRSKVLESDVFSQPIIEAIARHIVDLYAEKWEG